MKHLEIELKTLLKREDYLNLKELFSDVKPVTQKNYYIDSPDFILRKNKFLKQLVTWNIIKHLVLKMQIFV